MTVSARRNSLPRPLGFLERHPVSKRAVAAARSISSGLDGRFVTASAGPVGLAARGHVQVRRWCVREPKKCDSDAGGPVVCRFESRWGQVPFEELRLSM